MNITDAILLGLLQGVTEFLPVSSSAHLVAAQDLLGVQSPGVALEVALHFGTLLAILTVFWRELAAVARDGLVGAWLWAGGRRAGDLALSAPLFPVAVAVIVGSVPAAACGLLWEERIAAAFDSLAVTGAFLMLTGLLLLASRFAPRPSVASVHPARGFAIGLSQAAALLPGISRSGSTIVTGLFLGVERRAAGRFSFVLATPALTGAALLHVRRALPLLRTGGGPLLAQAGALASGTLVAAAVGAVCLLALLRVLEGGRLHWFAAYCLPAGALMVAAGCLR